MSVVANCTKLFDAVESHISAGSWAKAFRGCGFGEAQKELGSRAKGKLQWPEGAPEVGSSLPSFADLQAVWLRGKHVPIDDLFRLTHSSGEDFASVGAGDTPVSMDPWAGRLRSRSAPQLVPVGAGAATGVIGGPGGEAPVPWGRRVLARGVRLGPAPRRPPA